MSWNPGDPLRCSSDGKDILGTCAWVAVPEDANGVNIAEATYAQSHFVVTYHGTKSDFLVLHPKCLHDVLDEVLRQEGQTILTVGIGKVEDVRSALMM